MSTFEVHAFWDPEASVWVAESDDVPGLATEADTMEALRNKLVELVPELLALNSVALGSGPAQIRIVSEETLTVDAAAAA